MSAQKLTIAQAINEGLRSEMAVDKSIVMIGEDIGKNGGVFRVTEGLQQQFGSDRVIDSPLAENAIVGTSVGMALSGLKPIPEIQFMGFVYYAMNQLLAHAARFRHRSRGRFNIPMVIRMPFGGGIRPPEHHSESYEALFLHSPGMKVVVPASPYDAKGLLIASIRDPDPVMFLEPTKIYRSFREDVPDESYVIPLGKAKIAKEGSDVTILAWGAMVRVAIEAAQWLEEKEKISAEVIDLRSLNPLDRETVFSSVEKTGRAVIVHEAPKTCGFGSEIACLLNEHLSLKLLAPVERVTGFDSIFPYGKYEKLYLPNKERVVRGVKKCLSF